MTTRTRELYPARMIGNELVGMPGIFASTGADPLNGIPLGWLRQLVSDLESHVRAGGGTQEEVDSIRVFGAENLRASFSDTLTAEEQLRDELAKRGRVLDELRRIFGAYTESKDPGILKVRELLEIQGWANTPGTPAVPAGPAHVYSPADPLGPPPPTQAEIEAAWLEKLRNAGWQWPRDARIIGKIADEDGISAETAELLLGLPLGEFRARLNAV